MFYLLCWRSHERWASLSVQGASCQSSVKWHREGEVMEISNEHEGRHGSGDRCAPVRALSSRGRQAIKTQISPSACCMLHPQMLRLLLGRQRLHLNALSCLGRSLGHVHPNTESGSGCSPAPGGGRQSMGVISETDGVVQTKGAHLLKKKPIS